MGRVLRMVAADDEPDVAQFYGEALAALGHQVAVATNGRQLVELCGTVRPHVLIADINMPELDGIEAAKQVCQREPVAVILVSGADPAEFLGRVPPAFILLRKPVRLSDLEAAIALAVRRLPADTPA